jgi:hypothetical protein
MLEELPLFTVTAVTGPGISALLPMAAHVEFAKLYCATFVVDPSNVIDPAAIKVS